MNYAVEGILLALEEEKYLASIHTFNFVLMCSYALVVQHYKLGLYGMWAGMATYQCARFVEHSIRFCIRKPTRRQIDIQLSNA